MNPDMMNCRGPEAVESFEEVKDFIEDELGNKVLNVAIEFEAEEITNPDGTRGWRTEEDNPSSIRITASEFRLDVENTLEEVANEIGADLQKYQEFEYVNYLLK